jgi:peptide-methionine (S)-S-oxide reductase
MNNNSYDTEVATLASGCFWCSEAVFRRVKGIKSVLPGYSGETVENPSYKEMCEGKTGHAESIQIEFDPEVISFEKILDIFWHTHNVMMLVDSTCLQSFSIIKHKRRLPRS